MRVNELAKQLGVPSTELLKKAKDLGMELTHHSNSLSPAQVAALGGTPPTSGNGAKPEPSSALKPAAPP
ncbi:MAG TPA: translation initiation factor IF-2 N-terminal domain-containing protein, partial [bacterium]|nr:translation initiation factor IF-2 N-terminal domain-containing protein [bacterium]